MSFAWKWIRRYIKESTFTYFVAVKVNFYILQKTNQIVITKVKYPLCSAIILSHSSELFIKILIWILSFGSYHEYIIIELGLLRDKEKEWSSARDLIMSHGAHTFIPPASPFPFDVDIFFVFFWKLTCDLKSLLFCPFSIFFFIYLER